ncbi:MAG TPA: hypothetical protein PLV72_01145 [Candidatus Magasanikbacteria bacterium]|nr:hypothetical protein [Candidatus Magasanikbacteria bacterium]
MENSIGGALRAYWFRAVVVGFISGAVFVGVAFLFPFQYRADADILVISRSRTGTDPYTAAKSTERVAENLAEVIGSSDFYAKVKMQSGYGLDFSKYDSGTALEKRRAWQKAVSAEVVYGTGVLRVSAFESSPVKAEKMVAAISDTIVNRGLEYTSGEMALKIINEPTVGRLPARPNLFFVFGAGIVLGFALVIILALKTRKNYV